MAMIHSQLYKNKNDRFDGIDMARHIGELADHLQILYSSVKKVDLVIEPSKVYLSLNQAIPCALIINELISNSLKHAFVNREQGKILISIYNLDDNTVLLKVKDDGAGIPGGIEVKSDRGIGLKLVEHLVRGQLKGDIQFNYDDGADIRIEFLRSK